MISAFQELGEQILAKWNDQGQAVAAFQEIAAKALQDSHVLESVEPAQIIDWLSTASDIPEQFATSFGQPPINVYISEKFYIEVLFWVDGTTAIHEHSFSGAFGVLAGSSIHSRYNFELRTHVSPEVQVGDIKFTSSELLERGDIRAIDSGGNFIHALFHLDRPSISVVVRTKWESNRQFSFLKPYVAYDARYENKITSTKLRMLESLNTFDQAAFWDFAHALLKQEHAWTLLHVLSTAYTRSMDEPDKWNKLLESANRHHSEHVINCIETSIREESKVKKLTRLRSVIHDSDLRFFLALLLNIPSRETLLALVAERFGTSEPEALVVNWIAQMSDRGLFRSKADPVLLDTIRLAMRYRSFDEARSSWERQKYEQPVAIEKMKQMWDVAHSSEFLQPLFR
jgi:hypothetical protein